MPGARSKALFPQGPEEGFSAGGVRRHSTPISDPLGVLGQNMSEPVDDHNGGVRGRYAIRTGVRRSAGRPEGPDLRLIPSFVPLLLASRPSRRRGAVQAHWLETKVVVVDPWVKEVRSDWTASA